MGDANRENAPEPGMDELVLDESADDGKLKGLASSEGDFTIYVKKEELTRREGEKERKALEESVERHVDKRICIKLAPKRGKRVEIRGRALAALCHDGNYYSITVREKGSRCNGKELGNKNREKIVGRPHPSSVLEASRTLDKFKPGVTKRPLPKRRELSYLYDFDVVCDILSRGIFGVTDEASGLIVVAGSTGTGKSSIVRGLIHAYLSGRTEWKRRPHLVTLEDPVELYAREFPPTNPLVNRSAGWDYTPRTLKVDVESVREGLSDAKRMKPAVVYVGETRNPKDWKEVVDFAGSGHLVVTTTHASSLAETISRIFHAVKADTPAGRGAAAQSLLAAVHVESMIFGLRNRRFSANVPALWKRTTAGSLKLVVDGLASILPGNPVELDDFVNESSLGRHWFSRAIESRILMLYKGRQRKMPPDEAKLWTELKEKAAQRDLITL